MEELKVELREITEDNLEDIKYFTGEPNTSVVGFIHVQGLDRFHQFVKENGWEQISDIYECAWGGRECSVTTIDGSVILFFETTQ